MVRQTVDFNWIWLDTKIVTIPSDFLSFLIDLELMRGFKIWCYFKISVFN